MKIRSVTSFFHPGLSNASETLKKLSDLSREAIDNYQSIGIEVQTTRLATVPFSTFLDTSSQKEIVKFAHKLEKDAAEGGYQYAAIGPALPQRPDSYARIPEVFAETENVFACGVIATREEGVSLAAVKACGEIIARTAKLDPNGFANLRFTALANVHPFAPFFPAAFSQGEQPAFALAVESADLAMEAFKNTGSFSEARENLLRLLESHAHQLAAVAETLSKKYKIAFKGIDISLAPFPQDWCSLGGAMEMLAGNGQLGLHGSLAAAAFIAETLDRGKWQKIGFNGLMLPVLEDSVLAKRSVDEKLTVKDLLLYSSVCGTGLDTVPLPGDSTAEQLSALLVDIAFLAVRLDKQLTARLMPVPGKMAGERTSFNFEFFENGKILPLQSGQIGPLLQSNETIEIQSRYRPA